MESLSNLDGFKLPDLWRKKSIIRFESDYSLTSESLAAILLELCQRLRQTLNIHAAVNIPESCRFGNMEYEEWCLLGCYAVWLL
jgi:hypothetical protein